MSCPARRTATWRRRALGIGALILIFGAGIAAMWTGWLPSRPIQWNDLNGRLVLGPAGADTAVAPQSARAAWPSAPTVRVDKDPLPLAPVGLAADPSSAVLQSDEARQNGAMWGSGSRSHLTSTSGHSGFGGGGHGGGGGLGAASGAGVTSAARRSGSPTLPGGPKAAKSSSSGGSRSGGGGSGGSSNASTSSANTSTPAATFSEQTTTVADLAAGTTPGAGANGAMDLGFGGGAGGDLGLGGGSMSATPEPASILLLGTGILSLATMLHRRLR